MIVFLKLIIDLPYADLVQSSSCYSNSPLRMNLSNNIIQLKIIFNTSNQHLKQFSQLHLKLSKLSTLFWILLLINKNLKSKRALNKFPYPLNWYEKSKTLVKCLSMTKAIQGQGWVTSAIIIKLLPALLSIKLEIFLFRTLFKKILKIQPDN